MTARSLTGVKMTAELKGLACKLRHEPSGTDWVTDPPKDNGGNASSFSPTDSVGAALLSCMLTTMALLARRESLPWGDCTGTVEKIMANNPRRIAELRLEIVMPKEVRESDRARFEETANGCPVARSLSPELLRPVAFHYA